MSDSVIKTAARVFEVLEYMRSMRRSTTVREISEELGYPLSSAQMLLKSIAQLGYLRYDARRRAYLATPRLALLGDWVLEGMAMMGVNSQTLEEIVKETGLTAILGVENDIYVQYTHVAIAGRGPAQYRVQPGTRRLLCMSSLGWALLSKESRDHVSRIVSRTNSRLSGTGQDVSLLEVETHIHQAATHGYAYSQGVTNPDRAMISVVTKADEAGMRYAVGISGALEEISSRQDEIVSLLKARIVAPEDEGRGLKA
ncbi:helix-turn-helix domain-containing protein [Pollutimonas bauzanensis]|uniref:IclR family transcriptional regulator n=1 Tax=Pollutimonas bauzanensis TaxID=658167 RepID=UPI00334232C0